MGSISSTISSGSVSADWRGDATEDGPHDVSNSTGVSSTNKLWITGFEVTVGTDTDPILQTFWIEDIGSEWWVFAKVYHITAGMKTFTTIYYSYSSST
jgi:hypothetical protein